MPTATTSSRCSRRATFYPAKPLVSESITSGCCSISRAAARMVRGFITPPSSRIGIFPRSGDADCSTQRHTLVTRRPRSSSTPATRQGKGNLDIELRDAMELPSISTRWCCFAAMAISARWSRAVQRRGVRVTVVSHYRQPAGDDRRRVAPQADFFTDLRISIQARPRPERAPRAPGAARAAPPHAAIPERSASTIVPRGDADEFDD